MAGSQTPRLSPPAQAQVSTPESVIGKEPGADYKLTDYAQIREYFRRLAMADDLTEQEARELASEGKAVVWTDAGLHATEVAPAQHSPKLLHRLATGRTPRLVESWRTPSSCSCRS